MVESDVSDQDFVAVIKIYYKTLAADCYKITVEIEFIINQLRKKLVNGKDRSTARTARRVT